MRRDKRIFRSTQRTKEYCMTTTASHLDGLSQEISALAAGAAAATVSISHKRHASSGFYWQPDIVVTASESLEARRDETVDVHMSDGKSLEGRIVGHDRGTDVALVRVAGAGVSLPMATKGAIVLGQALIAVGRTQQGETAALGFATLVGGAWRSMRGGDLSQRILIDARLQRAAEGSAVIDTSGHLRGMAVFGPRRRVVLIPTDTIERSATELLAHGKIRRGYLGVSVQGVQLPAAGAAGSPTLGLMVIGLDDNGPAATAGILRGDIFTAIDGKAPHSARALARLLPGTTIGQPKLADLVRGGQPMQVTVTVGEHPGS